MLRLYSKSKAVGALLSWLLYLVFLEARCANALPAAVLEALPVRPSLNTLDAALAALLDVCLEFFM